MTPQEKKELDFVIETLFKVAIGIVILFAAAIIIAEILK
jgi:hypothetical protein